MTERNQDNYMFAMSKLFVNAVDHLADPNVLVKDAELCRLMTQGVFERPETQKYTDNGFFFELLQYGVKELYQQKYDIKNQIEKDLTTSCGLDNFENVVKQD